MVPSWTETLVEAGINVVGRTRFCCHPHKEVQKIPIVGGTKDIQWEKVKELNASLLILDREENPVHFAEDSPIPFWASHITDITDVGHALESLAEALRRIGNPKCKNLSETKEILSINKKLALNKISILNSANANFRTNMKEESSLARREIQQDPFKRIYSSLHLEKNNEVNSVRANLDQPKSTDNLEMSLKRLSGWSDEWKALSRSEPMEIPLDSFLRSFSKEGLHCQVIQEISKNSKELKFFYIIWKNPWMRVNQNTFIGSVLKYFGIVLDAGISTNNRYPIFSESDFENPNSFFLFSTEPFPFHKKLKEIRGLPLSPTSGAAVIDGEVISWYGIRSLRWIQKLQEYSSLNN